MAPLKAYIDDSGSGGDSPWYVLAGYLGTVDGWDRFDSPWLEVLHREPRIEYFKASEAESLRPDGQWAGVSPTQRDQKIDDLIDVISKCALRCVCARMRQRDYDELVKGNVPPAWDSPYYFLQTFVIGAAINSEKRDGRGGQQIDFVFDRDQKHESRSKLLMPRVQPLDMMHGSLANVTFQDEKEFLPLQAADLVAWQIRRFFSSDEPRRRHFDTARTSLPEKPETFIFDRSRVRGMVEDMRETALRLVAIGEYPSVRPWEDYEAARRNDRRAGSVGTVPGRDEDDH